MDDFNSLLKKQVSDLVVNYLGTQSDQICHQIHEILNEAKVGITEQKQEEETINDGDELSIDLMAELSRKVVENPLIMQWILSQLRKDDLLNCRLVCTFWDEFATAVLRKRKILIEFKSEWNYEESTWEFYRCKNSSWRTLDMLTMLLRSSKRFPSIRFKFNGGNFKTGDIKRFFNLPFSNSITNLKVIPVYIDDLENPGTEAEGSGINLRDVGKILVEKLPNVDCFLIYLPPYSSWSGYQTSFFPPDQKPDELEKEVNEKSSIKSKSKCLLPALKNVSIIHNEINETGVLVREFLTAVPNLKRFEYCCSFQSFEILTSMNKESMIKRMTFVPSDQNIELWDKVLSLNLKLEGIAIVTNFIYDKPNLWKKVEQFLTRLFQQQKDNLVDFRVYGSLCFFPGLKFPVFKNVKCLLLAPTNQHGFPQLDLYSIFPKELNLVSLFPRVWSFSIYLGDVDFSVQDVPDWSNFLGFQGIFPNGIKLAINCVWKIPVSWYVELGIMFPNTIIFKLDKIADFPSVAPLLWKYFKNVKWLKLNFNMDSSKNHYPALDCGFSGLSVSQHQELEWNHDDEEFSPEISKNLSILEMKDLEKLRINLDGFSSDSEAKVTNLISTVSAQTFQCISQLKRIKIFIDDEDLTELEATEILDLIEPLKDYGVKIHSKKLT